jgi:hypothetical protein
MTDIEQELLKLVNELRSENAALLELVLDQNGLLSKEVVSSVATAPIGKTPWYIRQRELSKLFRVHKEVEVKEVKEVKEEEEKDAS